MRNVVMIIVVVLVFNAFPALADGAFFGKTPPPRDNIDPKSYALDISEPEQKAVIIDRGDGQEILILQVSYAGKASEFAWLVPTPSRPQVTRFDSPIFHRLHNITAPTVRYWLDADNKLRHGVNSEHLSGKFTGAAPAPSVEVLEMKQVGIYNAAVLKARNEQDLVRWLKKNGYMVTSNIAPVLKNYIERGWIFTAMKITKSSPRVEKRLQGGILQSVQFKFKTNHIVYPLKISSLNPGGTNLLLYVISPHKMITSLLKTECVQYSTLYEFMDYNNPSTQLLTKMTAALKPSDMTEDLFISQAPTDELMDPKPVTPPFLWNLGAAMLYIVSLALTPVAAVCIFVFCCIGAVMPGGRKRWWLWAGIGLLVVLLSQGHGTDAISQFTQDLGGGKAYAPYGRAVIVVVAALLLMTAVRAAWSRRLLKKVAVK